jgi:asparagine synthase (glutamine-hydrolysing)
VSGIVGIFERSAAPVDRGLLQALAHFLSQRGPDGRGTWSQGAIGLGQTMLRTTRESQIERQPASLDGQLWITADARIDCREELEKKLEQQGRGAASRTTTDSDLILRAYAAWGADCVQHLRGDFAFAIWDARKKLLFCARDHFGVKPFYYSDLGERFLFSNTLNCLRQHPDVSDDLNDAAIGDFLLFGLNCDAATTTFRDIRRLPAAHAMTVNSEGLRIQRYWSAPTEGRIRYRRAEDYVEHFQILLQAAVADRTRVERVGILLSGGLDSATIAATARELADATLDLRAYTVVYESLIPDQDREHARRVAEFLRIPLQCIPMDRLQPFERWDDPEVSSPEPVDDPFFAGLFDQFRRIAVDCRVVLSSASALRCPRAEASNAGVVRKRSHRAGVPALACAGVCASPEPEGPRQGMERAPGSAPASRTAQGARIALVATLVCHVRTRKRGRHRLSRRGTPSLFGFASGEFPAGASTLPFIFRKTALARGCGGAIA